MVSVGDVINPVSGWLLVALGIWIALKGPREAPARLLAWFSGLFGAAMIAWNAYYDFLPAWLYGDFDIPDYVASAFLVAAAGALTRLSAAFPRPLAGAERRLVLIPLAAAASLTVAWWADPPGFAWQAGRPTLDGASVFLQQAALAVFWGVAIVFARRYGSARSADERRAYAVLSVAILLYPAYYAGFLAARFPVWSGSVPQAARALVVYGFAFALCLAFLWLLNAWRSQHGASAGPRNVALFCLAFPLGALLVSKAVGPLDGDYVYGLPGLARVATVLVVAYAILRHRLLGLDMKVRWTLSRGTIAAAFIAVFFVVTEVAKELVSDTWGSILGVGAAGALVFALSPLQRAAERLAERAVPSGTDAGATTRSASAYRAAVRTALADGAISREEEDHLAEVQEHLGLTPREALRLRREVEDERRG